MVRLFSHFQSSVGKKMVIALTGLGLVAYVVFHMLGNLQLFEGPQALNKYAAFLRDIPILLWTVRIGLLSLVVVHIGLAIQLSMRNRRARSVEYTIHRYRQASIASRTMTISGIVLLVFVGFHLLHLTAGVIDLGFSERLDSEGHRDVYGKVVHAFQNPFIVIIYLAGQLGLGLHLSHAISSSLQTMGLERAALNRLLQGLGVAIGLLVVLGNIAIILGVFLGIVH
ncbi:MAG TPA: succinate dehydrogenase cytochrome b subunit [Nitrospira sp.]|nr:succinate dehydrogenase cytochrome b subunit [Nitrospira sp.]